MSYQHSALSMVAIAVDCKSRDSHLVILCYIKIKEAYVLAYPSELFSPYMVVSL